MVIYYILILSLEPSIFYHLIEYFQWTYYRP